MRILGKLSLTVMKIILQCTNLKNMPHLLSAAHYYLFPASDFAVKLFLFLSGIFVVSVHVFAKLNAQSAWACFQLVSK